MSNTTAMAALSLAVVVLRSRPDGHIPPCVRAFVDPLTRWGLGWPHERGASCGRSRWWVRHRRRSRRVGAAAGTLVLGGMSQRATSPATSPIPTRSKAPPRRPSPRSASRPTSPSPLGPGTQACCSTPRPTSGIALMQSTRKAFGSPCTVSPDRFAAEGGSIVAVSSVSARLVDRSMGLYCASKAALEMVIRVAAAEWAPSLRVNGVAPGVTDTPMLGPLHHDGAWLSSVADRTTSSSARHC